MVKTTQKNKETKVTVPALPLTINADIKEYRKRLGVGRIVLALLISLLLWVRFGFVVWLVSIVVIAAIISIIIALQARRRLEVTDEGLTYSGPLGNAKSVAYTGIENAIIFVQYVDWNFGAMPRLFVVKKDGSSFVSLIGLFWSVEELDKLISTLQAKGIDVQFSTTQATSRAIAVEFPKLLPAYERRPGLVALVTLIVLIVIIALFAAIAAMNG